MSQNLTELRIGSGVAVQDDGLTDTCSMDVELSASMDNDEDEPSRHSLAGQITHKKDSLKIEKVLLGRPDVGHNSGIIEPLANLDAFSGDDLGVLSKTGRTAPNSNEERNRSPNAQVKKESILEFSGSFVSASGKSGLGMVLSNAREDAGLTQTEVAKIMGTDHRAVRRIEKGDTNPTWETAEKYANAVGLQIYLGPSKG
jgi:DNA-binding XRE family transcriptional regulator